MLVGCAGMAEARRVGINTDGTVSICKARPENVGKGRCKHIEHVESSLSDAEISRINEDALEKQHEILKGVKRGLEGSDSSDKKQASNTSGVKPSSPNPGMVFGHGAAITRREFDESVQSVSQQFDSGDYHFIQDFYRKYKERTEDPELQRRFGRATDNVYDFLRSGDPVAIKTRKFLGRDMNLRIFSEIIAKNVGAMTLSKEWENDGRDSTHKTYRVVMTSALNDMNRERYIASVMFFGGRCCYCHRPFTRGNSRGTIKSAPSGEHLTPVNAKNPPPGATRYGNMALACIGCNSERGNKDLNEWVSETSRIPEKNKQQVLDKIAAFRKYALHKEIDDHQYEKVKKTVERIDKFIKARRKDDDGYDPRSRRFSRKTSHRIKGFCRQQINDLKEDLRV